MSSVSSCRPLRQPDAADMRHLLDLLSPNPIDTDDLARESGFDAATLSALLLELALAGRDRMAFKLWVRNSEPTTRDLVVRYRDLGFRHLIVALPMSIDSAAGRAEWLAQVAEWTRS